MRSHIERDGLETSVSMLMLILAASLIVSGSIHILDDSNVGHEGSLRHFQIERMGVTFVRLIEERQLLFNGTALEDHPFICILWDGQKVFIAGNETPLYQILEDSMRFTPDGLWSFLWIGYNNSSPNLFLEDLITWKWTFFNGLQIKIHLPLIRCSCPDLEDLQ